MPLIQNKNKKLINSKLTNNIDLLLKINNKQDDPNKKNFEKTVLDEQRIYLIKRKLKLQKKRRQDQDRKKNQEEFRRKHLENTKKSGIIKKQEIFSSLNVETITMNFGEQKIKLLTNS